MSEISAGHDGYVASLLEKILSGVDWNDEQRAAVLELFEFLCANSRQTAPRVHPGRCAIAIDTGNECLVEVFHAWLPDELRAGSSAEAYHDLVDVVKMVGDTTPDVLVIITNHLLRSGPHGIAACVAVSPSTRYVILTGWSAEAIQDLRTQLAPLPVRIDVLGLPCTRAEFCAALRMSG